MSMFGWLSCLTVEPVKRTYRVPQTEAVLSKLLGGYYVFLYLLKFFLQWFECDIIGVIGLTPVAEDVCERSGLRGSSALLTEGRCQVLHRGG